MSNFILVLTRVVITSKLVTMQTKRHTKCTVEKNCMYNAGMPRKLTKTRPRQGAHLMALRKRANLSQIELAQIVDDSQQNIAYWEQSDKPPRSDVLPKLASALGISVEELLNPSSPLPKRHGGPVGKVRKTFEEVSRLPRSQQDKIIEIVSALIAQFKKKTG
jgi:transcriptional regulator with XRE-family HTH domain